MSVFKSEKVIPITLADLTPVTNDVVDHFTQLGYEVAEPAVESDVWSVTVTKGGKLKAAVGLKTALKIEISRQPAGTLVRASATFVGRRQVVPTAITALVPPAALSQAWGLIRQSRLDDEAIMVVEHGLDRLTRLGVAENHETEPPAAETPAPAKKFCTGCGQPAPPEGNFCAHCGQRLNPQPSSAT